MITPKNRFTLVAILGGCIFIGLQLITIDHWNAWHDESFTIMLIQYDWGELMRRASFDVHPPLFYLILKTWGLLFGYSIVVLRSFSVLCMAGVFTLGLWLVRRLAGPVATWWTLPVLALAPALVRYGQEARMYGLASLLGLTATHLVFSLLRDGQKKWTAHWWGLLVGYVLCVVALLYTHYFAALVILVHWVLFIVSRRQAVHGLKLTSFFAYLIKRELWWFVGYSIIIASFLPWVSTFSHQLGATTHNFWVESVGVTSFFSTISTFLFFHPAWLEWQLTNWYGLLAILGTGLISYFIIITLKSSQLSAQGKILFVGYWSIPMILIFLISLPPLTPYYFDRYLVIFSPFFYSLLGVGSWLAFEQLRSRPVLRMVAPALVLASLLLGTWNTQVYGNNFGHASADTFSMRELSAELRTHWESDDMVIAVNLEQYFDARFYLSDLTEVKYYTPFTPGNFGNTSVIAGREDLLINSFNNLYSRSGRVWIISDFDQDPSSQVPAPWIQDENPIIQGYGRLTLFTIPQTFPQ